MQRSRFFTSLPIIMVLLDVSPVLAQPLIVDHQAVQQFDSIPEEDLAKAREATFYHGSTSHGMQILSGLLNFEAITPPPSYSVSILTYEDDPVLPPEEDPAALRITMNGAHPEDYWDGEAGLNETRGYLDSGLYGYTMWSWCGEHEGDPDVVQEYLDAMTTLEQEYPDVKFIYATGHASGIYANNNDLIRDHVVSSSNGVLFDFEDIESYDPDGNYYADEDGSCTWCEAWCLSHPEDCENLLDRDELGSTSCCPHSHGFNCRIKAKAFWWMMAQLTALPEPSLGLLQSSALVALLALRRWRRSRPG